MKTSPLFTYPLLALVAPALTAQIVPENITENEYDDINPIISGQLIVWQAQIPDPEPTEPEPEPEPEGEPEPADFELMIKFGDQFRQLTDNDTDDINPKVSGDTVVWQSFDGEDWEIWAYNAGADAMVQVTDNTTDDINPCIDGMTVVWQTMDEGGDYEIATASVASLVPSEVTLRVTPRSLNLRSRGRWVNASLSFDPAEVDPSSIDTSSILMLGTIPAENVRVTGTGLSMKFDREALAQLLSGGGESAELTVTAQTSSGELISGTDTIRIIE